MTAVKHNKTFSNIKNKPFLNAQHLDMTSDPKDYKKYTLRLDSQFNQQYMNTSLEFFLPAYFMPVLRKHIAVVGGDHPSSGRNMSHDAMKKGAAELYQGYIMSQVQSQKERLVRACYVSSRCVCCVMCVCARFRDRRSTWSIHAMTATGAYVMCACNVMCVGDGHVYRWTDALLTGYCSAHRIQMYGWIHLVCLS